MKVIINAGYGDLSIHTNFLKLALQRCPDLPLSENTKECLDLLQASNIYSFPRAHPAIIALAEEFGLDHVFQGSPKIVEVPDDVKWYISAEYDGWEHVAEDHRTWR